VAVSASIADDLLALARSMQATIAHRRVLINVTTRLRDDSAARLRRRVAPARPAASGAGEEGPTAG
jgi:hypothetical protein